MDTFSQIIWNYCELKQFLYVNFLELPLYKLTNNLPKFIFLKGGKVSLHKQPAWKPFKLLQRQILITAWSNKSNANNIFENFHKWMITKLSKIFEIIYLIYNNCVSLSWTRTWKIKQAHSEPSQTSKIELFAKIVNN